eukprot:1380401-Rhodomonas_salina.1
MEGGPENGGKGGREGGRKQSPHQHVLSRCSARLAVNDVCGVSHMLLCQTQALPTEPHCSTAHQQNLTTVRIQLRQLPTEQYLVQIVKAISVSLGRD